MGVSGSGKSSVGQQLAQALRCPFIEGDAFHAPENIARMSAGIALSDADRAGWLSALGEEIRRARRQHGGYVLSCSALKRQYRDSLRQADPALRFAHLHGEAALLAQRMAGRNAHFMPPSLLLSQLATLQPLEADEAGIVLDIRNSTEQLVHRILTQSGAAVR
ncbi:gluconokinase [Pseudoduganella sp. CY13W]|uniref:Gluconokinase n=2 Tax=Duganella qianjiadongensis TaxID=2692176 RepID=A0ABW9VJG5_9BURK|nr:gluconokinase [Duganella qianjiadongensis]